MLSGMLRDPAAKYLQVHHITSFAGAVNLESESHEICGTVNPKHRIKKNSVLKGL